MIRKGIIVIFMLFPFFLTDIGLSDEGNNFSVEINEPYEITSENMFIEREKKTIGFSGNVILKQGSSYFCLLYTSPSPRDPKTPRMPSSA